LKVGTNRVWIDPDKAQLVGEVITRNEIRRLIREGWIKARPKKGVSRARARLLHEKKKRGRRRGAGSRSGKQTARLSSKTVWENRIRAIRVVLKDYRKRRLIRRDLYRRIYLLAKGGTFRNVAHVKQYIEAHRPSRQR
jgi:large subunit ribosomal protein L19e